MRGYKGEAGRGKRETIEWTKQEEQVYGGSKRAATGLAG
jgi:hypothetical protein